jgi:two-component system phosphate regulon sensor histidine kinase PhoR
MRLFLQRIPPETKVAAVVLGAALVQVGLLATLGLRSTTERRAELEGRMRDRSRFVVARGVVGAGVSRVNAEEQALEREIQRYGVPIRDRVVGALSQGSLYGHAFLVDSAGTLRDWRREPLEATPPSAADPQARKALRQLLVWEREDAERALGNAEPYADSTTDPVAAALMLQAGWRAARALKSNGRALELAERVLRDYRTLRDDRGALGESEPFGLGAAFVVCELRLRALEAAPFEQASAFVDAVLDRRQQAHDMRHFISPLAYGLERDDCRALLREVDVLLPTAHKYELRDRLDEFDALDAALERARGAGAGALRAAVSAGEPARLPLPRGEVLTVLPLPQDRGDGPAGASAVAFLCDRAELRRAALEPARLGLDLPDGVQIVVRDDAGRTLLGPDDGDLQLLVEGVSFGSAVPGLWAGAVLADPAVLERETESTRRYWLWILAGAGLAVVAASILAIRAVLREVRLARLKSDFVSNLSHELRTPLTSLRMFVETLQEGRVRDEAEAREYLDIIAQETDRLSTLVDRVLQFAAFTRGRAPIELKSVPMGEILARAAELFSQRAAAAGAQVETRVEQRLPEAMLDRDAMIQVVLNLLDNAVKHGGDKGVKIRVTARAAGTRTCVEVEDDGPGVPERERELVFEEFYRGDDTPSSRVQGTGIGLALCRRIVLAHGGTLSVDESRALGGARFRVTFPDAAAGRRLAVAAPQGRA